VANNRLAFFADSYFNIVSHSIPLSDAGAAVSAIINEIGTNGLPVLLSFPAYPSRAIPDGSGGALTYFSGLTWYLPPELGSCSRATLDAIFAPHSGHFVNIVGYWISGSTSSPDPFNSYFIIENNWGKEAGYHSFFFMNFAALTYLANNLLTYRLDRMCWSVACERQPNLAISVPPGFQQQLQLPPDPAGPVEQMYEQIVDGVRLQLGGIGLPDILYQFES